MCLSLLVQTVVKSGASTRQLFGLYFGWLSCVHRMALALKTRQLTSLTHSTIVEMDEQTLSVDSEREEKENLTLEKQLSRAEIRSQGMGSKTASLYLSRSASLAPSTKPTSENNKKELTQQEFQGSQDEREYVPSKKTSVASMQKEFTFTGYDIMTDG